MSALAAENPTAAEDSEEEFVEIPESEKTPVTIVTGFLGK
jgi:hypothetical protein